MKSSGIYQDVYIKRDGELINLKKDVADFCDKCIKPVHPKDRNWSVRDFVNPKYDSTIEEATSKLTKI